MLSGLFFAKKMTESLANKKLYYSAFAKFLEAFYSESKDSNYLSHSKWTNIL